MFATVAEYESRWQEMVRELRAHPRVRVTAADTKSPIDDSHIARLAGLLGRPVPDDLRTFFLWTSHLTLSWSIEGYEHGYGGSIRIPSVDEMGQGPSAWPCASDVLDAPFHEHGLDLANGREGGILPFDFIDHSDDQVELAVFLPTPNLNVSVSVDHGVDLDDTGILSFAEYMDFVFRTYGSPEARPALNSTMTRRLPVRDVFPALFTKRFTLDSILAITEDPNFGIAARNAFFH